VSSSPLTDSSSVSIPPAHAASPRTANTSDAAGYASSIGLAEGNFDATILRSANGQRAN
jgi:hypothetical protein